MNLNTVAKQVCELEGGKVNLSIAQVKEVIKCLFIVLERYYVDSDILDTIERTYDRYNRPKG